LAFQQIVVLIRRLLLIRHGRYPITAVSQRFTYVAPSGSK
jgi:hypothetical protein